ncbi:MAG: hypothetical protein EAZ78_03665 [Oscillatoriales cyanobacterium]|uniref:hypothetical protein n=1 Tax=Microcoleus anatoxicus TaxID=2705319 RepID=UPI002970BD7F|nr:MAG: hypothetical protein EAZ78_03665 [Oscillatoriales cyanobacterium]TAF64630.1 MAG: hypothetical protein EAZ59_18020 [Oscillatoriales cyanobacterium]
MKEISLFGLMVGFVIFGAGSESVLAQTTIAVPAIKFCVDSGINVSRGDSLQFSASGQGSYGYEGSPVNSTPLTNPDGDRFVNGVNIGKKDDPNAIYKGFIGGLVGKVGTNGNYFFIGSNNQLSMGQSGRLFLCYNDVANSFNNNTGGYRVSINRISDPNQQNTAGRSPSASQQTTTGRSQQLTRCVKWSTFTQGLTTTSGGRGGIWLAFNELPDGFKQGCIFFQNNNAIDVAYVLKDGIEPSTTLSNGHHHNNYGGVPAFGYDGAVSSLRGEQSQQSLEDLMRRGQALMITWLTPTNGSIPYLNSIPRGRAFVRDDGMVCYSTVCMSSRTVSNQELARILEAGQNVNTAGRSPSPNQQTTTGRSPSSNQQNPQRQTQINGDDTIVYNNIVCSGKTRNFLGQESPASCRSKEADSRLIFNSITWERQADRSIKVEMKVFNQGSAEALVQIYNSKKQLVKIKIIEGNKPPTGLIDSGIDMFTRFPVSLFNQYSLTDARKNLNEQEFSDNNKNSLIIPPGGYLKITKSSNEAFRYNAAMLSLELVLLTQGDPGFAKDETVKQFVKRFAEEAYFSRTSKTTINFFKSEPNSQAMFTMDLVDPNKAAEVFKQLIEFSVSGESDPSKNPFIGAFLDVYKDVGNIGLEIALDKFILPGLGTFVKATRITGSKLNTFARGADLYYATAAGEKATITLEDADKLRN